MSTPIRSDVFTPARIGGLELPNRLIRAGCYEGLARDGDITDGLIEHHRRLAAGGIAMTTLGYLAVSSDGRGFAHELWARPELAPRLCRFTDSVHAAGAAVSVQLVHCGFFSNPKVIGKRPLGASAKLCMYRGAVCAEMTPAQIGEKVADFARAARMARDAGFDAVELHAGHGYLLSQFLSPWTNRRRDEYGGGLENRLRFPAEVVRAMRDAVGAGFPILVKLNQRDGFPGGDGRRGGDLRERRSRPRPARRVVTRTCCPLHPVAAQDQKQREGYPLAQQEILRTVKLLP